MKTNAPPAPGPTRMTTAASPAAQTCKTAFGCRRDFATRRFVYTVISARARGLSVGIDMNPDKFCNFDCAYCEVNRQEPPLAIALDVPVMAAELEQTLKEIRMDALQERDPYRGLPQELLQLRQVAFSGDGEPTLCPDFLAAVETVIHIRARRGCPFFKMVLITNASGLDLPGVQAGLKLFTPRDEVWAKLETGTQEYMNRVNKPAAEYTLEKIMAHILALGRERPVIIQSLFTSLHGQEPGKAEILAYAERLNELKAGGAQISLVQIYSATRPTPHSECGHLALRSLSQIARVVRTVSGLPTEVF